MYTGYVIYNGKYRSKGFWVLSIIRDNKENKRTRRFENWESSRIMPNLWMLRRVALVRADVSEEHIVSIIRVRRISELGTTLAIPFLRSVLHLLVTANTVPSSRILSVLKMKATRSSKTSVLSRVTRRNISEDAILHSHRRENLKS
jgi:hypothetical protein